MNASSNEDAQAKMPDSPDTDTQTGEEQVKLFVGGLTGDTTNGSFEY